MNHELTDKLFELFNNTHEGSKKVADTLITDWLRQHDEELRNSIPYINVGWGIEKRREQAEWLLSQPFVEGKNHREQIEVAFGLEPEKLSDCSSSSKVRSGDATQVAKNLPATGSDSQQSSDPETQSQEKDVLSVVAYFIKCIFINKKKI